MAGNEICCTVKLDEDDWKAIERAIMTIEKRLERLEAILDARGLDWDHPRVQDDHFAGADKMVADEPKKKWRRLTDEFVHPGDWMNAKVNRQDVYPPDGGWIPADPCYFGKRACTLSLYFARLVADEPANKPEPVWEPKVGDWVRVRRPDDWDGCRDPDWLPIMHEYHDKVMQVSSYENRRGAWCAKCDGVGWFFHRDWLTPSIQYFAEPPEIDKPLETEYQRPSLPKDAGKLCEFSDDGESWVKGYLKGFDCDKNWNEGIGWLCAQNFLADRAGHRFARIKKDA